MSFRPPPFYPLTDAGDATLSHADQVCRLAAAGARMIQIRDKDAAPAALLREIDASLAATARVGALLVVNDRVDLARLGGAGGAHVGEEDLPVPEARALLGPVVVIGRSSHDAASARAAEAAGADYVAVGPVYDTGTKPDAGDAVGLEAVREVRAAVRIPVVAIGGITLRRAPEVLAAGADSVAVIRDVSSDPDPERRARAYLEQLGGADYPRRGVLFLTGFMGTGKSAVGRSLAGRLSRRFVDLDAWIEERVGMTVPKIFARRGEAAFREAEAEALRSIPRGGDAIVALGGGTLLRSANQERVRERGTLVWLDAPLDEALRRCGSGSERPLLGRGAAADLYAARLPGYRSAPVRVSTAGRSVEEATHDVLRHVHREKHGI